jgi:hypothetical protein
MISSTPCVVSKQCQRVHRAPYTSIANTRVCAAQAKQLMPKRLDIWHTSCTRFVCPLIKNYTQGVERSLPELSIQHLATTTTTSTSVNTVCYCSHNIHVTYYSILLVYVG